MNKFLAYLFAIGCMQGTSLLCSSAFCQTQTEKKIEVGISLHASWLEQLSEFYDLQVYSTGAYLQYGPHMLIGSWDVYSSDLVELPSWSPRGFQIGYRYINSNLLPFAEVYGEFVYSYYSYVNRGITYRRIRDLERFNFTRGNTNYVYMGNLSAGMRVPFWDRLAVSGSAGSGTSFHDIYIIELNRSASDWRQHFYFRLGLTARVWGKE